MRLRDLVVLLDRDSRRQFLEESAGAGLNGLSAFLDRDSGREVVEDVGGEGLGGLGGGDRAGPKVGQDRLQLPLLGRLELGK